MFFLFVFFSLTVSLVLLHFKGKRRHRRPRWSNIRSKRRKLNEGGEVEDRGKKQGEEESEAGSDSEESCKSEEIPSEDACTHCGLPNHPELVREEHLWLCLCFTVIRSGTIVGHLCCEMFRNSIQCRSFVL